LHWRRDALGLEQHVSTSRIQLISKGRRVPYFRTPEFRSADHPWAGYSFEEAYSNGEPLPSHAWPKTTLVYVTGPQRSTGEQGSLHWKHRGIWSTDAIRPGTVSIIRRDVEIQATEPSGSFPMMVLQLDNSKLQHLAPTQALTIDKCLSSAQVTRDFRLTALLSTICQEVREGCISGRLYAESISLALLVYLAGKYAAPWLADNCTVKLSSTQQRSIVDYIRASLTGNISVTELAGLVQMSPAHFSRVFKASFGVTPYRYVMRERVEGAKAMLASAELSGSQVAIAFGFASQSHFVKVFRQFTGVTPKQYQAGL
jgi:AraC family transcriptional regulator